MTGVPKIALRRFLVFLAMLSVVLAGVAYRLKAVESSGIARNVPFDSNGIDRITPIRPLEPPR